MNLQTALESEAQAQAICMQHPDYREAYEAFVAKARSEVSVNKPMDRLISQLPFFTPEHRNLAQSVAQFVAQEIEPRAAMKTMLKASRETSLALLAQAGLLKYAVAESKLDVRSLCLIREALSYSSALADLAFVMQGLGTYAIARPRPITCATSGSRAPPTEKRSRVCVD